MTKKLGAVARFDGSNVLRGLAASRSGEVISLNLPLDDPIVPYDRLRFSRTVRVHNQFHPLGDGRYMVVNDDEVQFALQGTSHWDSFAHFGIAGQNGPQIFHGGATLEETYPEPSAPNLGIHAIGPGIVTRGVLIDVVAQFASETGFLPGDFRVTKEVIERCLAAQEVEVEPGDAVLIYTGFQNRRASLNGQYPPDIAGLDGTTVELWGRFDIQALICDNPAVESTPNDHAVHIGILIERGIPLGELWALEELAQACRGDGHYDFTLASVPLNIHGAFGSPANAVAIR